MKVIQIMPEFGLAGAEIMCENLTMELARKGIEVIVISMFNYHSEITERLEASGIRVLYLDKKPGLDLSMIPKMAKIFRSEKPDAIHTHRYVMQYAIPASVISGIKRRIHTVHNIATKETTPKGQKLNQIFYHLLHVVPVALSEEVKKTILDRYKLPEGRVPVIFNGIDLDRCIRKESYKASEKLEILHIGRFAVQKNHEMMLEAYKQALTDGMKAHLTLVGTGELEEVVRKKAEKLEFGDSLTFYGTTGNVYPLLHDADVFFLPSSYEGMPMTLLEAMGSGLPIVSTMVGGIPDMLEDEKEAILTEVSVGAIKEGLLRMSDEEVRKKLGKAARERAYKDFSAAAMAMKYINLYKR